MRDYSNIPALAWTGPISAKKAIAQVHHAEPVILQMPEGFIMAIDAAAYGCKPGTRATQHIDCRIEGALTSLAKANNEPALIDLEKVAHEAGQVMDIDTEARQIVIHD